MRPCLIKHNVTTPQTVQAYTKYSINLGLSRKKQGRSRDRTGVEQAPALLVRTEPPPRNTEQNVITKVNSFGNLVPRLLTDCEMGCSFFFIARNYLAVREKTNKSTFSSIENKVLVLRSL